MNPTGCWDCGRQTNLYITSDRMLCHHCIVHRADGHEPAWELDHWCHTDPRQLQKGMSRIQRIRYKRQLRRHL